MASIVAIVDIKGKSLIQRTFRDDVPVAAVERFLPQLLDMEEEAGGSAVAPCFTSEGVNYMFIRHNNLYLVALSRRNSNAAELLLFLHKLASVLEEYFKELEEESIRDNFVIIYELLDEMMVSVGADRRECMRLLTLLVAAIGLWLPPNHRIQDPPRVHHAGITQARGPSAPANGRHQRRLLAQRGNTLPQE